MYAVPVHRAIVAALATAGSVAFASAALASSGDGSSPGPVPVVQDHAAPVVGPRVPVALAGAGFVR